MRSGRLRREVRRNLTYGLPRLTPRSSPGRFRLLSPHFECPFRLAPSPASTCPPPVIRIATGNRGQVK